jgi:X-Pro dipeptidyl-peptidase
MFAHGAAAQQVGDPPASEPQAGPRATAHPVFEDGQAQIVPAFQDNTRWVHQQLWVETEFDSDHDGKRDRVYVEVVRPQQTETEGLKVPVIYESSPYYAGLNNADVWSVTQEVDAAPPPRMPAAPVSRHATRGTLLSYVQWVPRGFAVVHSESPGTGLSQGCATIGGSNEALAPKAVIDWLNGRARGFTTADGDAPVVASWSTGKVGMVGASYNGTLALAAATTGIDGLKAIIPAAPVASFYEYYRSNGLVRHPGGYLGEDVDVLFDAINTGPKADYCAALIRDSLFAKAQDRVRGDYNAFWAERNLLPKLGNVKAAVFIAHGFSDWNVMTEQSVQVYEALKRLHRVPLHIYYHQGSHGGDPPFAMMNRWFTRYLYDVRNGVEQEPRSWIVREGSSAALPTSYADYPNPDAANVTLYPRAGGPATGGLSLVKQASQGKESLTDDVSQTASVLANAPKDSHRLLYTTPVLNQPVHVSGWSTVTLRLASSKPAANLSVYVIAIPGTPDSAHKAKVITRGWADPQNYNSLTHGMPLVPGRFYPMTFHLEPEDRVIPAGVRPGLMIFSSDSAFTLHPAPGTKLTVDIDGTSVTLPVVGGATALKHALTRRLSNRKDE